MVDYARYYDKRTLVSHADFLDRTGRDGLVCLDIGVLHILRQLAKERALWRSTYYKSKEQERYELPTSAEFDLIDAEVSKFLEETADMATCEQLLEAVTDVATAIRQTACCEGNSTGIQDIGGTPYYGLEDPLSEPTAFGEGEEFETEQDYLDHKCYAANAIAYGLSVSLSSISVISIASLTLGATITGAAIAFGLFNPPAALIFALVATGLAVTALHQISNYIEENLEELVCILYTSTTAVDAYDDVQDWIDGAAIDLGFIELEAGAIVDIVMSMAPIDTMNNLYRQVGIPEIPQGNVSCDYCEGCSQLYLNFGYVSFDDDPNFQLTGGVVNASYKGINAHFNYDPVSEEYCGSGPSVKITSIINLQSDPSYNVKIWNRSDQVIYESINPPNPATWFENVRTVYIRSLEPTSEPIANIGVDWG